MESAPDADPRVGRPGARRVAVVDSGIGLLGYADALATLRPDLELVLAMDSDHMPYGPRPPHEVALLLVELVGTTLAYRPEAVVVACNTASVHGLEALRDAVERAGPRIPVIGTVPAIRPAAATGGPVAIWATQATTGSAYQRRLVADFAHGVEVVPVACVGLAEAIERGDEVGVTAAVEAARVATGSAVRAVVLGCTHYGLVADRIAAALPGAQLFDSPVPVARQTLRRLGLPVATKAPPAGVAAVLRSGRLAALPAAARHYPAGQRLAALGAAVEASRGDHGPGQPLAPTGDSPGTRHTIES